ncbi:hypothetical protein I5907_07220 [Panacibacter sp. DH6]|uniref:Uncharacterized protein n=1 Tax=Panacibacter microcysteis TaxID=2793269 RepID=A0A931GW89_9BACT|nr:hypothetical protein [Panacibacter microcysteis]MBG9376018.1 hypothetical protein [Panacibacter microcysteis]
MWLQEPVATGHADNLVDSKDMLSSSLMVLPGQSNAKQHAVFILKEAFAYEHAEIAAVPDITGEHSRKLPSRAKAQLKQPGAKGKACNRTAARGKIAFSYTKGRYVATGTDAA